MQQALAAEAAHCPGVSPSSRTTSIPGTEAAKHVDTAPAAAQGPGISPSSRTTSIPGTEAEAAEHVTCDGVGRRACGCSRPRCLALLTHHVRAPQAAPVRHLALQRLRVDGDRQHQLGHPVLGRPWVAVVDAVGGIRRVAVAPAVMRKTNKIFEIV